MRTITAIGFGCMLLSTGCYEGASGFGGAEDRGKVVQGIQLQGVKLQGIQLQGIQLQGIRLQGIQLQGIKLQGIKLQGITLQGITLQGITLQGTVLSGSVLSQGETQEIEGGDFIGAEFHLLVDARDLEDKLVVVPITLHIDDIYQAPDAETDDVFAYEVSYRVDGEDGWSPLCVDSDDVAVPAFPFAGYWDEQTGDRIDAAETISFSCHTGVVAKCALWGYRPWATAELCDGDPPKGPKWKVDQWKKWHCDEVSLADHHQACTRMARADYCGNGEPWTVDGTHIDIWDGLSPAIQEREADWKIEAEWTPDGAFCLRDIRQQEWKAEGLYPSCGKAFDKHNKKIKDCGSLDDNRALMVSSFEPPQEDKPKKKKKKWK